MEVTIKPGTLKGKAYTPPSKSFAHRALICAAMAKGRSVISPVEYCDDVNATLSALTDLGVCRAEKQDDAIEVWGGLEGAPDRELFCMESGSTLRFLMPLSLLFGGAVFSGRGRLMRRPMQPWEELCAKMGVRLEKGETILLSGRLEPGDYDIRGDVSSQYISGMLMALPKTGDSTLRITTPLQSAPYVEMTLRVMREFGVEVLKQADTYIIKRQDYIPCSYQVEGDYSSASYFLVAAALGAQIETMGLKKDSCQADRAILDILEGFGCGIKWGKGVSISSPEGLNAQQIDASQCPDLVPALAALACGAKGETRFFNASRLRAKESDRLESVKQMVLALGGEANVIDDELIIHGTGRLTGGFVRSFDDHRIAMAAAAASVICEGEVTIDNRECVKKSFIGFWDSFEALGGRIV